MFHTTCSPKRSKHSATRVWMEVAPWYKEENKVTMEAWAHQISFQKIIQEPLPIANWMFSLNLSTHALIAHYIPEDLWQCGSMYQPKVTNMILPHDGFPRIMSNSAQSPKPFEEQSKINFKNGYVLCQGLHKKLVHKLDPTLWDNLALNLLSHPIESHALFSLWHQW